METRMGERRMGQIADWHTAKIFSIAQAVVVVGAVAGGIWYLANIQQAQALIASHVDRHEMEIIQMRRDRVDREDIRRLENKIDQLTNYLLGSKGQ